MATGGGGGGGANSNDYLLDQRLIDAELVKYPPEVEQVLKELFPSDDPLDDPNFNIVNYINTLFPTEQSLASIDDVVGKICQKTQSLDEEIRSVIRTQTETTSDGNAALGEAENAIETLFVRILDIKEKADQSERMVKEITRDIKKLDNAKRNLTTAITTLNHLQMLVSGIDSLQHLSRKRQYGEVASLLEGLLDVLVYLDKYNAIPEINELSNQMTTLQTSLGEQILGDFKDAFKPGGNPVAASKQLSEACRVVNILEPKYKKDLLTWFIELQLQEYLVLFSPDQDSAWLDKIDRRFSWIKKTLADFEQKFTHIFPPHWMVGKSMCTEFCKITRDELTKVMKNRQNEIEVKLLLFAIQRTTNFEELMSKKFAKDSETLAQSKPSVPHEIDDETCGAFSGAISRSFEPYLHIYIESLDKNLGEMIARFSADVKRNPVPQATDEQAVTLPCCADFFVYYKKCLIQCCQLSTGTSLLSLTQIFAKYLNEFAHRVLLMNLPNKATIKESGIGINLGANLTSLLSEKDSSSAKLTQDEVRLCCVLLSSAEYCLETAVQLEEKLKTKINPDLQEKVSFASQYDSFHNVISACIQLLVQDLENSCEPPLVAMSKLNWLAFDSVRDTSNYVNAINTHIKSTVPIIRDCLASARKYFTQFCVKFVNSFIPKFISYVVKCKPLISFVGSEIRTFGAEQLLLDTHSLKTILMDLPSIGSQVVRKPPASYTKIVVREMTRAEMMLKVVMSKIDSPRDYVEYYLKLLQDTDSGMFQKLLDMKGMKKHDQIPLIDLFRARVSQMQESNRAQSGGSSHVLESGSSSSMNAASAVIGTNQTNIHESVGASSLGAAGQQTSSSHHHQEPAVENESSRMRRLEKLIKRKF